MQIVKFDPKLHWNIVKEWWDSLGGDWKPVPMGLLPEDGYVAFYEGNPVAAMFIYFSSNSKMAFLAWPISDRNANSTVRAACLMQLDKAIQDLAISKGAVGIFASAPTEHVANLYKKFGYVETEKATQMIRELRV